MVDSITLTVDDRDLQAGLRRLEQAATDLTPAMRKIAQAMALETERNFEEQGRPRWQPLARSTTEARVDRLAKGSKGGIRKDGRISQGVARRASEFRILQDTGQLAASVATDYDARQAVIGSNKEYAAIHQFGGKTKPHTIKPVKKKALAFGGTVRRIVNHPGSDIPARPFLPVTASGELQPEAKSEVLQTILRHLQHAAI